MNTDLRVHAFWDEEARVWVAESDDVPGLITEADTLEKLSAKLEVIIPELLELNLGITDMTGRTIMLSAQRQLQLAN